MCKGKIKEIVIQTDGDSINVAKFDVTPLEACEIFRRLLKKLKGDL